jgi:hypothetical protein
MPLLRSELSRLSHRRFARVMALILLGGIVLVSLLSFLSHGKGATSQEELLRNQAVEQQNWEACAQLAPDPDRAERRCGVEPNSQPPEVFDWQGDRRYKAYELLPVALIGATIASAGVAFLVGASCGGAEWSSRSMTLQLLFEPRRLRLLTVKWLSLVLSSLLLSALAMLVAVGLGALTASARGTWDNRFALTEGLEDALASAMLLMGLRGLLLVTAAATVGYAIAMLVRNTGASLGVAFVYFAVVENGVRFALMKYGTEPFMLSTNAVALLVPGGLEVPGERTGPFQEPVSVQVDNLRAAVTVIGYTLLLSLPAAWSFQRRDVG